MISFSFDFQFTKHFCCSPGQNLLKYGLIDPEITLVHFLIIVGQLSNKVMAGSLLLSMFNVIKMKAAAAIFLLSTQFIAIFRHEFAAKIPCHAAVEKIARRRYQILKSTIKICSVRQLKDFAIACRNDKNLLCARGLKPRLNGPNISHNIESRKIRILNVLNSINKLYARYSLLFIDYEIRRSKNLRATLFVLRICTCTLLNKQLPADRLMQLNWNMHGCFMMQCCNIVLLRFGLRCIHH